MQSGAPGAPRRGLLQTAARRAVQQELPAWEPTPAAMRPRRLPKHRLRRQARPVPRPERVAVAYWTSQLRHLQMRSRRRRQRQPPGRRGRGAAHALVARRLRAKAEWWRDARCSKHQTLRFAAAPPQVAPTAKLARWLRPAHPSEASQSRRVRLPRGRVPRPRRGGAEWWALAPAPRRPLRQPQRRRDDGATPWLLQAQRTARASRAPSAHALVRPDHP